MNFTHTQLESFHVITASGRLDITNAPVFEQEMQKCLAEGHTRFIIDMSGVDYISSAGLRSILVSGKAIKKVQGELRFCGLTELVEEVFTISGFKSMYKIFDSIAAATCE